MKRILPIFIIAFLLCGCQTNVPETAEIDVTESVSVDDVEMFTSRDSDTSFADAVKVTLSDDGITCDSDSVRISANEIVITDANTYVFSGTLSDGMITVDCKDTDKPHLVFDNVNITSSNGAPLYVSAGDKITVTLLNNNLLTNGGSFSERDGNTIDGVVFSKSDISFNGNGSLEINSPAGHGIVCKDDLVLAGGSFTFNTASHGIDSNDSVRIKDAVIKAVTGKDGIHCENTDDASLGFVYIESGEFDITAGGDGISAAALLRIKNGNIKAVTGGGSVNSSKPTSESWGGFMGRPGEMNTATESESDSASIKGLKSSGNIEISDGIFNLDTADDAVHSNASITVTGGSFEISSGDDGFHADETLKITNGTVNITESYEGLEALDIDVSGGDISLVASDDGLNAAGGNDQSGFGGMREKDKFGGGRPEGMGGHGGPMGAGGGGPMNASSDGSIVISGGNLDITASGDGIDANGYLSITGGFTTVSGPTQGDTATLDYDTSATISGGTFIGTGASGMAQTFSESKQGVVAVSVGNISADTPIKLSDKNGNVIIDHTPKLNYAVVILSAPDIEKNETYTVSVGDQSADFKAS